MSDTIEQAARVIYKAGCMAVGNWPPRHPWESLTADDRATRMFEAQALHEAGMLVFA